MVRRKTQAATNHIYTVYNDRYIHNTKWRHINISQRKADDKKITKDFVSLIFCETSIWEHNFIDKLKIIGENTS